MVCLAANGGRAIAGGNWQIFDRMVNSHRTISAHLDTTITHVSKQLDGTYNVTTSNGEVSTFDEVIIATPLQFSNLIIDPAPKHTPDQIPYVALHVTLFATPHRLDPKAFGLEEDKAVPQYVLTTLQPGESYGSKPNVGTPGYYSVSVVKSGVNPFTPAPRPEYVYKIFSPERPDANFLSHILGQSVTDAEAENGDPTGTVTWVHHKLFHSYPQEYPRVTFEEIKLDDGLWYTSGIESFISTMETSALSGKNVAQLVVDEWVAEKADGADLKVQPDPVWQYEGAGEGKEQKPLKAKL